MAGREIGIKEVFNLVLLLYQGGKESNRRYVQRGMWKINE